MRFCISNLTLSSEAYSNKAQDKDAHGPQVHAAQLHRRSSGHATQSIMQSKVHCTLTTRSIMQSRGDAVHHVLRRHAVHARDMDTLAVQA